MTVRHLLVAAVTVVVVTSIAGWTFATIARRQADPIARTGDDFRAHVETVFRMQNIVLNELINAAELTADRSAVDAVALLAAEDRLVDSCRALNEAASIRADGREPGAALKLRVFGSIAECEASTRDARAFLRTNGVNLSVSAQ